MITTDTLKELERLNRVTCWNASDSAKFKILLSKHASNLIAMSKWAMEAKKSLQWIAQGRYVDEWPNDPKKEPKKKPTKDAMKAKKILSIMPECMKGEGK